MNPCELTVGITALANAIARNYNDEQLAILGSIFTQLGDTLALIAGYREFCNSGEKAAAPVSAESSTVAKDG